MMKEPILSALRQVFASNPTFPSESAFQAAFVRALGNSERELKARFDAAALPPRRPPQAAISNLAARKRPIVLSPEGKDPCAKAARLDVLWKRPWG